MGREKRTRGKREGGGQGCRVRDGKRGRHVESDRASVRENQRRKRRAREEEAGDTVGEMLTQRTPRRAQEALREAEDEPKGP